MADHLGPYELDTIITGDARKLAAAIPGDAVDLIFCDPVYDRIQDYRWMAKTAARILKMDRACLAWTSKITLPECKAAMIKGGLRFQSILFYVVQAKQSAPIVLYGLIPWTTPCLDFAKGRYRCDPFIPDTYIASGPPKNGFKWQKNPEVIEYWLRSFSKPGDIVVDFFSGSGTVAAVCKMIGRRSLSFEIDPARADEARKRLEVTPVRPALFDFQQLGMFSSPASSEQADRT